MSKTGEKFEKLAEIMATLRGPNGCPWDREQTYKDINPCLLEETHEVLEAVDRGDFADLKEELGDLLVQILFLSQLAKEENRFQVENVIEKASEKLIRRHPHVFGDQKAHTSQEVLVNWEKIKQEENKHKEKKRDSILSGLPKSSPALLNAFRIGEKTHRVGFDWPELTGILKKMEEEIGELKEAIASQNEAAIEHEYGDLLFTLANIGRFLKSDPETALRKSSERFTDRFKSIEKKARELNKKLQDLTAEEWNQMWEEVKGQQT
ncbi:MAG: nucleoside triphosphate pyrophosphohydrolase [Deltaproteobacteria bacterium]|nr:nucleoside triphosphate pyrophosphohydrolase [Deltaproteobacteria bacterium]